MSPLGFAFGWVFQGAGGALAPTPYPSPRRIDTMLWINDTPLQRYGLTLQRLPGRLTGVTRPLPSVEMVPDRTGGRYGHHETSTFRDLVVAGVMLDIALEDQRAAVSALKAALHRGFLEVRSAHAPNEIMRGLAGPIDPEPIDPARVFARPDQTAILVEVTIRCADGATYLRQPRRVRLSTARKPIVMGDLPVGGEITLEGPLSGAVDIDLVSPSGVLLKRLALRAVDLATGDSLLIRLDSPHALVKTTAAGVVTNVYHWRSLNESDGWWTPSPQYADPARNQWPALRLSTGAGWYVYAVGNGH